MPGHNVGQLGAGLGQDRQRILITEQDEHFLAIDIGSGQ
jgi:hypothetical protein